MKRLVRIEVYFDLNNGRTDMQSVYPDKPYFFMKASSKFVKYLIKGRLLSMHFSYHYN